MDKLLDENRLLKERFDKLEERVIDYYYYYFYVFIFQCQRWIGDEQVYLLKRIDQLENENRQLQEKYRTYQLQSEKCIGSVTDLIIKTLVTQEVRYKNKQKNNGEEKKKKMSFFSSLEKLYFTK
jgi:hypothetical protein